MGINLRDAKGCSAVREPKTWTPDPQCVSEIHRAQPRQGLNWDFEPCQFCFEEAAVEARIVRNHRPSGESVENLSENLFEGRSITEVATANAVYSGWSQIPLDSEKA